MTLFFEVNFHSVFQRKAELCGEGETIESWLPGVTFAVESELPTIGDTGELHNKKTTWKLSCDGDSAESWLFSVTYSGQFWRGIFVVIPQLTFKNVCKDIKIKYFFDSFLDFVVSPGVMTRNCWHHGVAHENSLKTLRCRWHRGVVAPPRSHDTRESWHQGVNCQT